MYFYCASNVTETREDKTCRVTIPPKLRPRIPLGTNCIGDLGPSGPGGGMGVYRIFLWVAPSVGHMHVCVCVCVCVCQSVCGGVYTAFLAVLSCSEASLLTRSSMSLTCPSAHAFNSCTTNTSPHSHNSVTYTGDIHSSSTVNSVRH